MFQRIWNFAKRHRKKLIFASLSAAGAYLGWKVLLPKLQQRLLEKLLKESLELARGEEEEKEKKASFVHKQLVSDAHVRKALPAIHTRHTDLFAVQEYFDKVRSAPNKESKLERFRELQTECLSRLVSSMYMLNALLLLHRIEFNIAGRELAATPDGGMATASQGEEGTEMHAAFLETTRYLKEEGIQQIADAVRRAVGKCIQSANLTPAAVVSAEMLEKFFKDTCNEADAELLTDTRAVAVFLPESVDTEVHEELRAKVKVLLDEARDYLESPQFMQVFKAVTHKAIQRLIGALGNGASDPAAAPLSGGQTCPLAKLNGSFVEISGNMLRDEGTDFVARFSEEPVVEELCQGLYFQDNNSAGGRR